MSMPREQSVFRCESVSFRYRLGDGMVDALTNVDLEVCAGEFLCLTGPSGSGKSTLLSLLGLIDTPCGGEIRFLGAPTRALGGAARDKIRRHDIGFVFQNFHLLEALTVAENVEYFLARQGVSPADRRARARETLDAVGLADHVRKLPQQLSGGQRQRVAVARALAKRPRVILGDELTANLDSRTGAAVMELLLGQCRERGVTLVVASHDPSVVSLAPRTARLLDGKLVGVDERSASASLSASTPAPTSNPRSEPPSNFGRER